MNYRKRKGSAAARVRGSGFSRKDPVDLTKAASRPTKRKRPVSSSQPPPKKVKAAPGEEKRLRKFREKPPAAWRTIYDRALEQRFYVLQRERGGTDECPEEDVEMVGSTGNIYHVHIGKVPSCDCPHARKGNECKHVLYIMSVVLHAPFDLVYQRGLLSSELRTIFAGAPPIAGPWSRSSNKTAAAAADEDGKRKEIEGDCPICFMEMDPASPESVTWCQAVCGNNMHVECFQVWASSKKKATCPFCRAPWKADEGMAAGKVDKSRGHVEEGYVNVGSQLGMSSVRDESTYSPWYTGAYVPRYNSGSYRRRY